jgi:thiamine pyrophosphate-dependent acetolactate synthase large subunit-like protein
MKNSNTIIFVNHDKNEIKRARSAFKGRISPLLFDAEKFFKFFNFKKSNEICCDDSQFISENLEVPSILSEIIKEFSNYGINVFTDAGATLSWSFQSMNIKENWNLKIKMYSSFNLHPMGFSNCALVGSGIGNDNFNLAIIGDGSLPMNSQELSHLGQLPNLKIVVVDNKGYGIIRNTQDDYYSGNHFGSSFNSASSLPRFSTEDILKSFGLQGRTISNKSDEKREIVSFFKSSDQYLILDIDKNSNIVSDYYELN